MPNGRKTVVVDVCQLIPHREYASCLRGSHTFAPLFV